LALSLSGSLGVVNRSAYEGILVMTYAVVLFSIGVQGLTMRPLLVRLGIASGSSADSSAGH
jgi:NhaP-type Na+/H+ or K+/H+ antiporter